MTSPTNQLAALTLHALFSHAPQAKQEHYRRSRSVLSGTGTTGSVVKMRVPGSIPGPRR